MGGVVTQAGGRRAEAIKEVEVYAAEESAHRARGSCERRVTERAGDDQRREAQEDMKAEADTRRGRGRRVRGGDSPGGLRGPGAERTAAHARLFSSGSEA